MKCRFLTKTFCGKTPVAEGKNFKGEPTAAERTLCTKHHKAYLKQKEDEVAKIEQLPVVKQKMYYPKTNTRKTDDPDRCLTHTKATLTENKHTDETGMTKLGQ